LKLEYLKEQFRLGSRFTQVTYDRKIEKEYTVTEEEGKYLLKTFPDAFKEIKEEVEEAPKKVTKPRKKKVEKVESEEAK